MPVKHSKPHLELPPKTCWVLTQGHAGMENQCIGLAEALGLSYQIKHVEAKAPLRFLPVRYWPSPLKMAKKDTPLSEPWPDILISCGRRSVAAAAEIKRQSKGRTFAIHLQVPHAPADWFDVIIVPEHDKLRGDNVITMRGSLHRLTHEKLKAAKSEFAQYFQEKIKDLQSPLIGLLLGGASKRQKFTQETARDLAQKLSLCTNNYDKSPSFIATPSRRTGDINKEIIKNSLNADNSFMWDGRGENPYFGILALADILIVTSDSANMVSEACFTGKPVYIYMVPGGSKRLASFNQKLIKDGYARPFSGKIDKGWKPPRLDEMSAITGILREKYGVGSKKTDK